MATTTGIQQGDVALQQTLDGGDFCIVDGVAEMCPGLEVAAYLSLFGGNLEDDGALDNPLQYWGNYIETEPGKHLRSRTQHVLRNLPATTANIRVIENAVQTDLEWLLTANVANNIDVAVSLPAVDTVRIEVCISADGEEQNLTYNENWKASFT
jgi:phage gp46-like protein